MNQDESAVAPGVDRYAVGGNPVQHSRSPTIHTMFARQTGESMAYGRVECPFDGFAQAVRAFAEGGARGCNVTMPFKFDAFALCRKITPRARLAGAANVMRFDEDGWLADNCDGIGLVRDIESNAGHPVAGRRVLLVGAGGGAAGVLGPLLEARPAELVIVNRTAAKAEQLVERHAQAAQAHGARLAVAPIESPGRGFDIVLNASASSLAGGAVPVPAEVLSPGALAVDLMYGPAARGFVDWAQAHGAIGRDGLGMLVEQAAEGFFVWRGKRPVTAAVLAAVRAELDGAVR